MYNLLGVKICGRLALTETETKRGFLMPGDITTEFGKTHLPGLKQIPRVQNLSKKEFLNEYVAKRKPVVMTGLMDGWEMNRWQDLDVLREKIGGQMVRPRIKGGRELLANTPAMSFSDFLDQAPEKDLYLTLALLMRPSYASFNRYLMRQSYPAYLPELAEDFKIPFINRKDIWEVNLWVGPGNSETPIHRDQMENLYFQIRGQKRFLLFPSANNPGFDEDARDENGNIAYEGYELLINPGEAFYFPSFWHHRVFGDPKWGISCNMWFLRTWQDLVGFVHNTPLEELPQETIQTMRRKLTRGKFIHSLKAAFKLLPKLPPVPVGPAAFAGVKSKEVKEEQA